VNIGTRQRFDDVYEESSQLMETLKLGPFGEIGFEIDAFLLPPGSRQSTTSNRILESLFDIAQPILDGEARTVPPF